jgi:hypothetical protein
MFTMELSRRLQRRRSNIVALGAHPGVAATDLARNSPLARRESAIGRWFNRAMERWIPTAAEAAEPIVHAACAGGVQGGEYYGPGGWLEVAGPPAKAKLSARASDEERARELWSISEALTGVRYLSAPEPSARLTGRVNDPCGHLATERR